MTLSTLAVLLGLAYCVPQVIALAKPKTFASLAKAFPRHQAAGFLLMGLGTLWFLYNVQSETISDFASMKPFMLAAFGGLGLLTCIFVRDFLAVRGLAVVLLLLAKYTLDSARGVDTSWRILLAAWAYLWVFAGIYLTVAPYRLRDYLDWQIASPTRLKILSAIRLIFGLIVVGLGLTVFK